MKYLPEIWQEAAEIKALQNNLSAELDSINKMYDDLLYQFFIDTATWGLEKWEKAVGIVSNRSLSYEQRRADILGKLQGSAVATKKMLKELADTLTGGYSKIIEHNHDYYFEILFLKPLGEPPNILQLKNAVEICKPAHLGFRITYSYALWGDIRRITWGKSQEMSWFYLKQYEVVKE